MSTQFFAIEDRDGNTIQFISVLLKGEREKIQANGYRIVHCVLHDRVWDWIKEPS